MPFALHVDADHWQHHVKTFAAANTGIVPVVKGNGYGFGRDLLVRECVAFGADTLAVGTYEEVAGALALFGGDIIVLTPWRPFFSNVSYDPRVIHTVGRVVDLDALNRLAPAGTRIIIEGETSMSRHGFDRHQLAAAKQAKRNLISAGFAVHLPLASASETGGNLAEAESWAAVLETSQLETTTMFVSHLSALEFATLRQRRPDLNIRPRIGTSLWLGDLAALRAQATVLDVHNVSRGERIGYRQKPMPRDGHLVIVAGGTSHGIGLEAPKASSGLVQRGKSLARGSLEAAGFALSPFTIDGKQRWFAEPPHMQASMLFVPGSVTVPAIGDWVDAAVRYTTATFDSVDFV